MIEFAKLINILTIIIILSAFCIAPVAASPAKIITDLRSNEVTIDDFHATIVHFTLNENWSDRTIYPFFKYCALDEKCWNSLTPSMKKKFEKISQSHLINYKLDTGIGLISINKIDRNNFDNLRAKIANQGWLDKDVYSSGTLKIFYKNNLNDDNKIIVKAIFTPKIIITYNHKFQIHPQDQKEINLIDKSFNLNTELSTDDRNLIELITKTVDDYISVNDVALLIEGGVLLASVGLTIVSCAGIPATLGTSSIICITSIGATTLSGGLLIYDASKNADVKNQVANNIKNLDFSVLQMKDEL